MDDCEKFLAGQKQWVRAVLTGDYASPDIPLGLAEHGGINTLNHARDQYEEILKHCPKHLREYRRSLNKQHGKDALWGVPMLPPGRPRADALAQEAEQLTRKGLSQPKIADELNRTHPDRKDRKGNLRPFTTEAVRKMLSRRRKNTPDKT